MRHPASETLEIKRFVKGSRPPVKGNLGIPGVHITVFHMRYDRQGAFVGSGLENQSCTLATSGTGSRVVLGQFGLRSRCVGTLPMKSAPIRNHLKRPNTPDYMSLRYDNPNTIHHTRRYCRVFIDARVPQPLATCSVRPCEKQRPCPLETPRRFVGRWKAASRALHSP